MCECVSMCFPPSIVSLSDGHVDTSRPFSTDNLSTTAADSDQDRHHKSSVRMSTKSLTDDASGTPRASIDDLSLPAAPSPGPPPSLLLTPSSSANKSRLPGAIRRKGALRRRSPLHPVRPATTTALEVDTAVHCRASTPFCETRTHPKQQRDFWRQAQLNRFLSRLDRGITTVGQMAPDRVRLFVVPEESCVIEHVRLQVCL